MTSHSSPLPGARKRLFRSALRGLCLMALALMGACTTAPLERPVAVPPPAPPAHPEPVAAPLVIPAPKPMPPVVAITPAPARAVPPAPALPKPSYANDAKAYRADAAAHLYALNRQRIYSGRLPPNLYAIGLLDVALDGRGQVLGLKWQRAPSHAPEVIAEIERTVRAAAPFPAPARMRQVTYTDVWLWHRSGNFQLDTLTEGQD